MLVSAWEIAVIKRQLAHVWQSNEPRVSRVPTVVSHRHKLKVINLIRPSETRLYYITIAA
jgi:hypothetical protein